MNDPNLSTFNHTNYLSGTEQEWPKSQYQRQAMDVFLDAIERGQDMKTTVQDTMTGSSGGARSKLEDSVDKRSSDEKKATDMRQQRTKKSVAAKIEKDGKQSEL